MAGSIHWASICLQSSEWISDPEEIFYCVNPLIGPLTFLFVSRIPERLTRSIFVRYRSVFTLSLFTRANGLSRISLWWARKSQRARTEDVTRVTARSRLEAGPGKTLRMMGESCPQVLRAQSSRVGRGVNKLQMGNKACGKTPPPRNSKQVSLLTFIAGI